jgi:hypothetical protein
LDGYSLDASAGVAERRMSMAPRDYAYEKYIQRAERAEGLYNAVRDLYGWDVPWKQAYYKALKDRLLSQEEKNLVKEFYPVR